MSGSETAWLAISNNARSPISAAGSAPLWCCVPGVSQPDSALDSALGTKWNALFPLAAFALLCLAWDVGARRLAGAGSRAKLAILRDGIPAFFSLVVLSLVVYVGTWARWLTTTGGYDRSWGAEHP